MPNSKISALTSATTPVAGTEVLPIVQSSTTKQVSIANLTVGRAVTVGSLLATSTSDNNVTVQSTGTSNAASVILKSGNGTTSGLYSYVRMINDNTAGQDWRFGIYGDSDIQLVNATGSKNLMRWGTGGDVTFNTGNLLQGTAAKGINFTANTPAAGMTSQLLNWYEEGTWTPTIAAGTGSITSYTTTNCTYTRVGRLVTLFGSFTITNNGTGLGNIAISNLPYSVKDIYSAGGVARENALTGTMCNITIDGSTTTLVMRTYSNGYPGATGASFKFSASYIV